ncbi:Serine/threonine-protein kinase PknD [Novipirellula aureliae]|uniref:Serine/threonine-protein kinase PknD n=1 Tax=Novipirellula aureliae TaxID=2527966 RepID=A0A5C6DL35_9BACT|nr:protein kinase [Novipirellula aureliae]TWU36527.1 Serine/threonine-protein kinase PknD [Novipirellula aureliae]
MTRDSKDNENHDPSSQDDPNENPAQDLSFESTRDIVPSNDLNTETVDLESTTRVEPEEDPSRTQPVGYDMTLSAADLEQTVAEGVAGKHDPGSTARSDPRQGRDIDRTLDASDLESTLDQTTPLVGSPKRGQDGTVVIDSSSGATGTPDDSNEASSEADFNQSILASKQVGATINPREMSDEDAELWESLTAGSRHEPSQLAPAIERSLRETNLQINARSVTKGKLNSSEKSDYRLVRLLGKGGMGNVYIARQGSLDRMIAVKIIRPLEKEKRQKLLADGRLEMVEEDRRQQFLSEAVVTGDLDHPNIVPIHDIAVMGDETLFYAMKRVVGTPWSKVIAEKTRDENLEILLKASDAIGFAHTRGVVHRDIKPENIMLGDFGVVMVMDWGLALPTAEFEKHDSVFPTTGLGGSPAFMAPEMATGPLDRITAASDVYLLGATLFMIITGTPPHYGETVRECIQAVTANKIREFGNKHSGELMEIALKAMATQPVDRYPSVVEFQQAIRDYRSHAESVALATRAAEDLKRGQTSKQYADFSRSIFGFEEALSLWGKNKPAITGLDRARILYAETAYANGDYDNGLQVLDPSNDSHAPLIDKLQAGIRERESRTKRFRLLRLAVAAMLVFILIGGSVAIGLINAQKNQARRSEQLANEQTLIAQKAKEQEEKQKEAAIKARNDATRQQEIAKAEKLRAEENERLAIEEKERADAALLAETKAKQAAVEAEKQEREAKQDAIVARDEAETQRGLAEYESYLSNIGLVKARIERNNFEKARSMLRDIAERQQQKNGITDLGWEYRWLKRQVNQSQSVATVTAAVKNLVVAHAGDFAICVAADGSVYRLAVSANGIIRGENPSEPANNIDTGSATAAAVSADDTLIALGTESGEIQIWDAALTRLKQTLHGHSGAITSLRFADRYRLVSASHDRTIRIWDAESGKQQSQGWHIAGVKQIDIAPVKGLSDWLIAAAVADASSGRVVLWEMKASEESVTTERVGVFDLHTRPVSAVCLSSDGSLAASGDLSGAVMIWQTNEVDDIDYAEAIGSAITDLGKPSGGRRPKRTLTASRLIDEKLQEYRPDLLARSEQTIAAEELLAHRDTIRSIEFSKDAGKLLTASDDFTLKLWDTQSRRMTHSLRGHGGWVTTAVMVRKDSNHVLSGSTDKTVRSWTPETYVGQSVESRFASSSQNDSIDNTADLTKVYAHHDEIWSARFSPDGKRIVTASRDRTARVLRVDPVKMTLSPIGELRDDVSREDNELLREGTSYVAMSMAIDAKRNRLFVGSADSTIRIWDLQRGTEIGRMKATGLNQSIALSRNGNLLLSGSSSEKVKALLWNISPGGSPDPRVVHRLSGHDQAVTAFAISGDAKRLFTGDRDGRGILWDAESGKPIGEPIDVVRGYRINAAQFSGSGKSVFIAADDQQLCEIDLATRTLVRQWGHDGFVTSMSLSTDEHFALTISEQTTNEQIETTATLWDLRLPANSKSNSRDLERSVLSRNSAGNKPKAQASETIADDVITTKGRITSATIGLDGNTLMVTHVAANRAARISVWSLGQHVDDAKREPWFEMPTRITSVEATLPISSERFLTLNGDAAFLWDAKREKHLRSFRANGPVQQASFSADGKYIVTASRSIKVWNAESMQAIGKQEVAHNGPVRSVEFAKGRYQGQVDYRIVSGGDDGSVRLWLWNPQSETVTKIAEFDFGFPVSSVRMGHDGKTIFAAGIGGKAKAWQIEAPDKPTVFHYHPRADEESEHMTELTCLAVSDDGKWLAAGTDQATAVLWSVPRFDRGVNDDEVRLPIEMNGHAQRIEDIAILQDGSSPMRIFTASADQTVRVWDPRLSLGKKNLSANSQAREVLVLEKHASSVTAVDLADQGALMMSAGREGVVNLWPALPRISSP